jgi:hypothetical protein
VVGATAAARGIELEDRRGAVARRDRRMPDNVAEIARERLVFGVVEMVLLAKEQDFVIGQRAANTFDCLRRQVSCQTQTGNFSADPPGDRPNRPAVMNKDDVAHFVASCFVIIWTMTWIAVCRANSARGPPIVWVLSDRIDFDRLLRSAGVDDQQQRIAIRL